MIRHFSTEDLGVNDYTLPRPGRRRSGQSRRPSCRSTTPLVFGCGSCRTPTRRYRARSRDRSARRRLRNRGQRRRVTGHHVGRLLSNRGLPLCAQAIEPLPQRGRRRHRIQAQRLAEKGVRTKRFHGLEIRLAQRQQADHRRHHVAVRNLGAGSLRQEDFIHPRGQARASHQGPDQGQARMRGQRFFALRNFIRNQSQFFTSKVSGYPPLR